MFAELILTYVGGVLYAVCALGILKALLDSNGMIAIGSFSALFAGLFMLHQYAARLKFKREVALYKAGRIELDKLYEAGMAKEAARTAPTSVPPMVTS